MHDQRFDIVIPCFQPRSGWEQELLKGLMELSTGPESLDINYVILVNDGNSSDVIAPGVQALEKGQFEVIQVDHKLNRGKGAAVRSGATESSAPFLLYTDIDIPYKTEDVLKMAGFARSGEYDIVIAKRGSSYYGSLSPFRRWLSKTFLRTNKLFFRLAEGDTQGGLKVLNQSGKQALLATKIERYLFDLELIQLATRSNLRLKGCEVRLKEGISLPGFNLRILLQEVGNFGRLLFS